MWIEHLACRSNHQLKNSLSVHPAVNGWGKIKGNERKTGLFLSYAAAKP